MSGASAPPRQKPTPAEQEQYDLDVVDLATMNEFVPDMVPGGAYTAEEFSEFFDLLRGKRARIAAFEEKYRPRTPFPRPQEARGEYSGPTRSGGTIYSLPSPQKQSTMFQSPLFAQATVPSEPSSLQKEEVELTEGPYVFGWQATDGSFVQNPYHPYWCGRKLVQYLRETDALENEDRPWYMADKTEPSDGGISLQHPRGVIDRNSYWAGLRDELQNQEFFFDGDWPMLPGNHTQDMVILQE
ncbi:hypothetical protein HBI48_193120 [Parastagonospora nodorum]|nr:hypothetical protein HBI48_193120 [Parastagonospora nodorum]